MLNVKHKLLSGAAAAVIMPGAVLAQEAPALVPTDSVFILNSLLFLIGGFLVFWMAAGFAMLEAGLVRSKNVTMQLTKNVALFSLAAIFYYLIGYNLMYPLGTWAVEGVLSGVWGTAVLEAVGVTADAADDYGYASTGSDFFFQLMFCAATASIVSGALAERIKLWPFLIFTVILTSIIYPLQASWKWGGGFLDGGVGFGSGSGASNHGDVVGGPDFSRSRRAICPTAMTRSASQDGISLLIDARIGSATRTAAA